MRDRTRAIVVRVSCRAYGLLLPLYSSTLRRQFGPDMVDVFEQQIRGECERHGFAGLARVWFGIVLDLTENCLPGEINWQSALVPVLSFLSSFALFALFFAANGVAKHCTK
jgi:hypothetical protein